MIQLLIGTKMCTEIIIYKEEREGKKEREREGEGKDNEILRGGSCIALYLCLDFLVYFVCVVN